MRTVRFIGINFLATLVLPVLVWSCATTSTPRSNTGKNQEYREDISAYRATPAVVTKANRDTLDAFVEADSTALPVTDKLNTVLDTATAYARANISYVDGFTIQVYAGNDRALAKDFQLDIIRKLPEAEPKMVFEQPNYKVRIGLYYTRLEAQEFYQQVKIYFPKAILIPTRIPVN